jgi:transposase
MADLKALKAQFSKEALIRKQPVEKGGGTREDGRLWSPLGRMAIMMGTKERQFAPLANPSLEDLVPADHFYRHLERSLDLAFVRALVQDRYAVGGRPSIDPVVFFKLQLILFFEGLRSERQLMQVVADRLSLRWYLGYDLGEPVPDHSSLTRIRDRYGLAVFRRFFETIVEQCQAAGLVWGAELYIDATKVAANASIDSVLPRFAVEAHLEQLFAEVERDDPGDDPGESAEPPPSLPAALTAAAQAELTTAAAQRHDWLGAAGRPDRSVVRGGYRRTADFRASATDPDASLMRHRDGGLDLGYQAHYVVDGGTARIVLVVLAAPAEVQENQPALDLLWHARFRWKVWPRQVSGDTTYGTREIIVALEDASIRAYVPLPDLDHRTPYFGREKFTYDPVGDAYHCPAGQTLPFRRRRIAERIRLYQAPAAVCNACPRKGECTAAKGGRQVRRSEDEAYLDRVRGYHATEPYRKAMRKRQVWVEPLFAEAKQWHGLRRFRLRGLPKVNIEALLIATGQNLKRLLSRRGWGRRPWPTGAPGLVVPPAPGVAAVIP